MERVQGRALWEGLAIQAGLGAALVGGSADHVGERTESLSGSGRLKACVLRPPRTPQGDTANAPSHPESPAKHERILLMLSWAVTFLIIAIIAAILGFGGIMATSAWIAKVLFVVFLILFIVSLVTGRRPPVA